MKALKSPWIAAIGLAVLLVLSGARAAEAVVKPGVNPTPKPPGWNPWLGVPMPTCEQKGLVTSADGTCVPKPPAPCPWDMRRDASGACTIYAPNTPAGQCPVPFALSGGVCVYAPPSSGRAEAQALINAGRAPVEFEPQTAGDVAAAAASSAFINDIRQFVRIAALEEALNAIDELHETAKEDGEWITWRMERIRVSKVKKINGMPQWVVVAEVHLLADDVRVFDFSLDRWKAHGIASFRFEKTVQGNPALRNIPRWDWDSHEPGAQPPDDADLLPPGGDDGDDPDGPFEGAPF
jgi:hypothetical protein